MRKTIITLAAVVAGVAAFGSTAGTAAADVANPIVKYESGPGWSKASCQNFQTRGVFGQYGAQGWFIDGCTVSLALLLAARVLREHLHRASAGCAPARTS